MKLGPFRPCKTRLHPVRQYSYLSPALTWKKKRFVPYCDRFLPNGHVFRRIIRFICYVQWCTFSLYGYDIAFIIIIIIIIIYNTVVYVYRRLLPASSINIMLHKQQGRTCNQPQVFWRLVLNNLANISIHTCNYMKKTTVIKVNHG